MTWRQLEAIPDLEGPELTRYTLGALDRLADARSDQSVVGESHAIALVEEFQGFSGWGHESSARTKGES